jgi:ribosomal protein S18 acetylase RimI-like enzyme
MEWSRGEYRISDDPGLLDLDVIQALLASTYWAKDRPRDVTERAIRGSFCLGLYCGSAQVGLARAITDHATFAWVCDVVVHPEHRRRGLGKWLVQTLIEDPRLQVRSQYLTTEDAHSLYERFGFARYETLKRHPKPAIAGGCAPSSSGGGRQLAGPGRLPSPVQIAPVLGGGDLENLRGLFLEYAASLGFSLCFQGFEEELATLPGRYASPGGCLLLLKVGGQDAGCVALRELEPGVGEIKRLYVRPTFRGGGHGRRLMDAVIRHAQSCGLRKVVLDTVASMTPARSLYASMGFREVPHWHPDPACAAIAYELPLPPQAMGSRLNC